MFFDCFKKERHRVANKPIKTQPKKISKDGLSLIKYFEGYREEAYKCQAGVWTIGFGHTKTAKEGMRISAERAERLLRKDVAWAEREVLRWAKTSLVQCEFDALVSLVFNIGVGAFKNSTLLKYLNEPDHSKVPDEFVRWVYANGRKSGGLMKRRQAERKLWFGKLLPAIADLHV